ncbi:hypothetical protein LTS10_003656 [Elasticomyces elasticus]|nr:hypothetical protein LTS10_003656 [Elasticomyces elasticus]
MAALAEAVELAATIDTSRSGYTEDSIVLVQRSAAASLASHSLGKRTGMAFPRQLKELLVMYEKQKCQQPYDLVYALQSLIDQKHRDHLQVNYSQSAEEYFCVVISFMHEHDDLGIEGIRIAWLLLRALGPSLIDAFRMPSQGIGLRKPFDMEARAFKLGSRPEIQEEDGFGIRARRNVAALSPILPWRLQLDLGSWVPEQRTKARLASSVFSIGPQDMLYFRIPGTDHCGLAAMAEPQFSSSDEIWLFAHTSYAFIVLSDASGSRTVRGRAALFNPDGIRYIGSELYPYRLPATENIGVDQSPYPLFSAEDITGPFAEDINGPTPSCVDMRLTIPDLITLATMANKAILD